MKKYELTEISKDFQITTVYRIRALIDIPSHNVRKGDLGGWIRSESNLSQEGTCWVADDAVVSDNARVKFHALVADTATLYNDAVATSQAKVLGNAQLFHKAYVTGHAIVMDNARVTSSAWVSNYAIIRGSAIVTGNAYVLENAIVEDNVRIYKNAYVEDATVKGGVKLGGECSIYGGVTLDGDFTLTDDIELYGEDGDICLRSKQDIHVFRNNWSSGRTFYYLAQTGLWYVGCFTGTGKELVKKAYKDSKLSGDMYKLYVDLVNKMEDTYDENNILY